DLDHVGTEVGQVHRAERTRPVLLDGDDAHVLQRPHRSSSDTTASTSVKSSSTASAPSPSSSSRPKPPVATSTQRAPPAAAQAKSRGVSPITHVSPAEK